MEILWPYENGEVGEFFYARYNHPAIAEVEAALGELDGGTAVLFPSGTGAATALALSLLHRRCFRSESRRPRAG